MIKCIFVKVVDPLPNCACMCMNNIGSSRGNLHRPEQWDSSCSARSSWQVSPGKATKTKEFLRIVGSLYNNMNNKYIVCCYYVCCKYIVEKSFSVVSIYIHAHLISYYPNYFCDKHYYVYLLFLFFYRCDDIFFSCVTLIM